MRGRARILVGFEPLVIARAPVSRIGIGDHLETLLAGAGGSGIGIGSRGLGCGHESRSGLGWGTRICSWGL